MAHLDPERLSAYIDHELPAAEMAAVERHLAQCEACRAEYDELRALSTLVGELPVYLPKREVDVSAYRRGGSDTLARVTAFSKPLAIAAVILLVAFAGLRLLTTMNDSDGDDGEQISFSAVQPTATGTESDGEASVEQAREAPAAAAPSGTELAGQAVEATLPAALNAMPAMQAQTPASTATAASAPTVTARAEPTATVTQPGGGGDSWLPEAVVAVVAVVLAGAAGWYRLVRAPARRRARSMRRRHTRDS